MKINKINRFLTVLLTFLSSLCIGSSQELVETLPFGDFDNWTVRYIKESKLLGGKTKSLYVVAPTDTIWGNAPFDFSKTIWGISNAYANVIGVAKAANSTSPEPRGDGYAACMESKLMKVVVLGLVNIKVAVSGTLFLGSVLEPVKSANDPYGSIAYGIPFTKKPKSLMIDIKSLISPENTMTKALGLGVSEIEGHDNAQITLYLQKRWEDEDGHIYAKRVGTIYNLLDKTIPEWENDYRIDIEYGDISNRVPFHDGHGLLPQKGIDYRDFNSKGKLTVVEETGWGDPEDEPTHLMLIFSAGSQSAFISHIGNKLWIDNVRFVY